METVRDIDNEHSLETLNINQNKFLSNKYPVIKKSLKQFNPLYQTYTRNKCTSNIYDKEHLTQQHKHQQKWQDPNFSIEEDHKTYDNCKREQPAGV